MLLYKITSRIGFVLNLVASVSLVGMMLLTVVDVCSRYFFNHPVTGVYDLVGLMGVVITAFSMPYTLLEKGHVAVEFFMQRLSKRKQLVIDTAMHLVSIILFLTLAWQCMVLAKSMADTGEVTPTLLIPFHPLVYCMAVCFTVLSLSIFTNFLNLLCKGE